MVPPQNKKALIERASQLAGLTIANVCTQVNVQVAKNLRTNKGFVGQILEKFLGANAHNLDEPDFVHLGIELKSIPVDKRGVPLESTYICYANLPPQHSHWQQSRLQRKTAHVLWVPYEGDKLIPLPQRRVGMPYLWQPSIEDSESMQTDYEELTELMLQGRYAELDAKKGKVIQLRPKAANSKTLIKVTNEYGESILTVPKGFYFRKPFTAKILADHYALV